MSAEGFMCSPSHRKSRAASPNFSLDDKYIPPLRAAACTMKAPEREQTKMPKCTENSEELHTKI
jgi:hypothetical protein